MANRTNKLNADKILKIEQQVQQFAQHIQKYKKLFLADDGRIDSEEQQQLDALQVRMDQINQRLAELKGGVETNLSPTENVDDSIDAKEDTELLLKSQPDDICDIIDRVYPLSNCTKLGDNKYELLFSTLKKNIFSLNNGSKLYKQNTREKYIFY